MCKKINYTFDDSIKQLARRILHDLDLMDGVEIDEFDESVEEYLIDQIKGFTIPYYIGYKKNGGK